MAVGPADFERVIFGPRGPTCITKIQTDRRREAGPDMTPDAKKLETKRDARKVTILAEALVRRLAQVKGLPEADRAALHLVASEILDAGRRLETAVA
jgi:hypothetical protein